MQISETNKIEKMNKKNTTFSDKHEQKRDLIKC